MTAFAGEIAARTKPSFIEIKPEPKRTARFCEGDPPIKH